MSADEARVALGLAVLDALDTLEQLASINVGLVGAAVMATCGPHEGFGPSAAAALVNLKEQIAMPIPMRPCPACAGAPEPGYNSGAGFRGVMCVQVACPLWRMVLPIALWNTLAAAMQLHQDWTTVAAVLREDTERLGEPTTLELGYEHGAWVADTTWWHHDGPTPEQEGRSETSEGALAVLAQHYRERAAQKGEVRDEG